VSYNRGYGGSGDRGFRGPKGPIPVEIGKEYELEVRDKQAR